MRSFTNFVLSTAWLMSLISYNTSLAESNRTNKYQVEVSIDITEGAAKRILSHNAFKPKERTDYVFDMYDGKDFLLFPGAQKVRFRLKEEENKAVIQINTSTQFIPRNCGNGIAIVIREKKNGELKPSKQQYKTLTRGNDLLEQFVKNSRKNISLLQDFSKTLQKLDVPLQSDLEKSFATKKWMYLPINITKKTKWKKKMDFGYGEINVSISKGKDFIGNSFLQEKWEIEFQVDPADWKNIRCSGKYCGLEKSVCTFLQSEEISETDLTPVKVSPYIRVKEIISPYNKDFGF